MKIDRNGLLHFSYRESRRLAIDGPDAARLRKKASRLMRNYEARQLSRGYQKVRYFSHRPEVPLSVP